MISGAYIKEWRQKVPWSQNDQVEQDLIICRALVEIFRHPDLTDNLAFRGGTALFKLHLPPVRYSEDIDLVQVHPGPIVIAESGFDLPRAADFVLKRLASLIPGEAWQGKVPT